MPNYHIEKLPNKPIVMVYFAGDFGSTEIQTYTDELRYLYEHLEAPVYQIADITHLNFSFDEGLKFIQIAVLGPNSIVKHPNNLDILVVTANRFYQISARGLNTATFGNIKILLFETLEAALTWVREKAA